jgi:hypothetical protein
LADISSEKKLSTVNSFQVLGCEEKTMTYLLCVGCQARLKSKLTKNVSILILQLKVKLSGRLGRGQGDQIVGRFVTYWAICHILGDFYNGQLF